MERLVVVAICLVTMLFGVDGKRSELKEPSGIRQIVTELNDKMSKVQSQLTDLKSELARTKSELVETKSELAETKSKLNERHYAGEIAFKAGVDGFSGSPTANTIILFNIVEMNIGGAYNPATGIFTAPLAGVYQMNYVFSAAGSCGLDHATVVMFVNGQPTCNSNSEVYSSGGTGLTLQLVAGDEVWVSIQAGAPCRTLIACGNGSCDQFSGHIIVQS